MTAAEVIAEARRLGVELYVNGKGSLCAYPAEGLPAALRAALRSTLAELLASLAAEPYDDTAALARACQRVGADLGALRGVLLPADLAELSLHLLTPPELDAFIRAIDTRLCRLAGRAPLNWTRAATCRHCGPVLLWPESPDSLDACPWCWSRRDGLPIPRPAIAAALSAPPNPEEGCPDEPRSPAVAERA